MYSRKSFTRYWKMITLAGLIFAPQNTFAADAVVKMKSISYDPNTIEISQGDSVRWKNMAYTQHSASSDDTEFPFDTTLVAPGKESRAIKFEKAGTYKYHCAIHGKTMSGTVVVKAGVK